MTLDAIMQLLGQIAFPAVICVALLWERARQDNATNNAINAMTAVVAELKTAVVELTAYIKGGRDHD